MAAHKKGSDFFSMDTDFFSDKKIKILKSRYGADGVTLFLYLLCELYKNGYYLKMDEDYEYLISDDLHMSNDKVRQVINFLLERSLFDNTLFQSDKVLTSTGIQKRFQRMVKSRAVKNPIPIERFWLLKKEETESFIKVKSFLNNSEKIVSNSEKMKSDYEKIDIKERKRNERKGEEINKESDVCFENKQLESAFQLYLTSRRANNQQLNEIQIQLLRKELIEIASSDSEQLAIVKNATMRGWKSFFPSNKKDKKDNKATKNKFNNFDGREQNYAEIEQQLLNK
jgi:hypothetical protein